MNELQRLLDNLDHNPRVLLLGQRLFGCNDSINPVLTMANVDLQDVYAACLGERANEVHNAIDRNGNLVPFGEELDLFRKFPWRCVFTSAIDPTPYRLFHDAKKRPITTAFEPRKPDSTSLTLFRLFGATGRSTSSEIPPGSRMELANRRTTNASIIGQISDTVGPTGRLYVVGWHPSKDDWLRVRDLTNSLNRLTIDQILIFGLSDEDRRILDKDDDFSMLLKGGKAVVFSSSLHELLRLAELGGKSVVDAALTAPDQVAISVRKHTPKRESFYNKVAKSEVVSIRLSAQEYNRLSETVFIPTNLPEQQEPIGTITDVSSRFLRFLSQAPLDNLIECDQFAFRRPIFENEVVSTVLRLLDTPSPQDHTVVLAGQSGAGKSIMIAQLAVMLRRTGIPVVIIANRLVPPNRRHIEDFLQTVDSHSSVASVILWDGLERPEEYQRLSHWVASLGKKALVVGTSYELGLAKKPKQKSRTVIIEVDIEAVHEKEALIQHFSKFLPSQAHTFGKYTFSTYRNFFELIYFLTSASRPRLAEGLDAEFSTHVQSLDSHLSERTSVKESSLNAFGHALRDAYADTFDRILLSGNDTSSDDRNRSPATRFVESVMIVSSLGLEMPQSLALSLCHNSNKSDFQIYQDAFKWFPIIDAFSKDESRFFVRARLRLEAEIWVERRFPSRLERLDVVLNVANKIKQSEVNRYRSDELEFVIRLLQTIGSEGPEGYRIPEGYGRIADCISAIEERCGRVSPRLLLVKANSLREHVQIEQSSFRSQAGRLEFDRVDLESLQRWELLLRRGEKALGDAQQDLIEQIKQSANARGARNLMAVLSTERAAIIGGQLICLSAALRIRSTRQDFSTLQPTLERARTAWRQSLTIDEENIRAIDTGCWVIRNVLEECPVDGDLRYDLLAEWSELITRGEELDLNPDQFDKLQVRQTQFAAAVGDRQKLEQVVKEATDRGNYAVHVLLARGLIELEGPKAAMDYLVEHCREVISTDRTVLVLFYRLWWLVNSRLKSFFSQDEVVVGFSSSRWEELLSLARARISFEGESENQLAIFHAAWANLQLRRTKDAEDLLKSLDTISVGNFRRGRSLVLLSDENSKPLEFTGETRAGLYSHKGKVWIEDLRLEIPFIVAQFPETQAGASLTGFHIAMNYRGAFVQPSSVYNNKIAKIEKEERERI